MAGPDLILKRHDTYPPLTAVLSDQNGAINLSTATAVKLIMKGATVLVTGACVITGATTGQISYSWGPSDTAVADTYQLEFEITWTGGAIETVPNDSYKTVQILTDLEPL